MLSLTALVFTLQPHLGLGASDLQWTIARDLSGTAVPNILSELKFENMISVQAGLDAALQRPLWNDRWEIFAEAGVNHGRIRRGQTTDFDFAGNNRTGIYSLSESNIEGDGTLAYSGGAGLRFAVVPQQHYLALMGGGNYHEQTLNFRDGVQLIADPNFFGSTTINDLNASLVDLDSDYRSEWWGGWFAAEYQWRYAQWRIGLRQQWFWNTYYGEGRWNLREDFAQPRSFAHEADAFGNRISVEVAFDVTPAWSVAFKASRDDWETDPGIVTTYFSNDTINRSRFNGAERNASHWRIGVGYSF